MAQARFSNSPFLLREGRTTGDTWEDFSPRIARYSWLGPFPSSLTPGPFTFLEGGHLHGQRVQGGGPGLFVDVPPSSGLSSIFLSTKAGRCSILGTFFPSSPSPYFLASLPFLAVVCHDDGVLSDFIEVSFRLLKFLVFLFFFSALYPSPSLEPDRPIGLLVGIAPPTRRNHLSPAGTD